MLRKIIPVGQIADTRLAFSTHRIACNGKLSEGRLQKPGAKLDKRGLSAAVRTQQPDYPAGRDLKVKAVQRGEISVVFSK